MKSRYSSGDGSTERARELRRNMSPPERALWKLVRSSRLEGYKFRRQQRLGPFFGDLVCHRAKLVVELDGDSHADTEKYDAERTAFLEREGYHVMRFTNADAMTNIEGVGIAILEALSVPHPPTASRRAPPSPPRGEG